MVESLQFLQLNMQKAGTAAAELHRSLPLSHIGIALLTEPTLYKSKVCLMPKGYRLLSPTVGSDSVPRAAILVRPHLNCVKLEHLCTPDCVVLLYPGPKPTIIFSAYLDRNLSVTPDWMLRIISYAQARDFPLLGGLDSNAHHTMYDKRTDQRGRDLVDFLFDNSVSIVNHGNTPTFDTLAGTRRRSSVIDLTVSHCLDVSNWRVDTRYNGSDHNSIFFDIPATLPPPTRGRRWSKADWPLFQKTLDETHLHVPRVVNFKKIDKMVKNLYRAINHALDKACPLHDIKPPKPFSHWYNEDHRTLAAKLKKQFKKAKRARNEEEVGKFRTLQDEYTKLCRKDRRVAWRKFTSEADSPQSVARLQKILQFQARPSISVFRKDNGDFSEPGLDSIQCLVNKHFPSAAPVTHEPYNSDNNTDSISPLRHYDDWINDELVTKALLGFDAKKSPGPDLLKPLVFKHFTPKLIAFLTKIYKCCVYLHYTPREWKKTRVVFIPKPGKDSYVSPKDYRPICLSNYLLKALERLAVWRVDQALVDHPLHAKQHGFLPGRSTESAISNTVNYAERALFQGLPCVGLFLDISAAFDSISIEHVRDSLLKHGADDDLVHWYYGYLQKRDLNISLNGVDHSIQTNLGFPQGGVCSAKFWIIAFNPAIEIINSNGIEGNGYADDISALFSAPRFDHTVLRLQKMLRVLIPWGNSCGLTFNASKTVAINFTRGTKTPRHHLTLNGLRIEYSNDVRYLGVTLDKKLHWKTHIVGKIEKARKLLFKLRSIASRDWGPTHFLMRWAYTGIIRPMLTYGAFVWGHEIKSSYISGKLDVLNRLALTLCSQVPKSTPTSALSVLLHIEPLQNFIQKSGLATLYRLQAYASLDWSGTMSRKFYNTSHRRYWLNLIPELDLPPVDSALDFLSEPNNKAGFDVDTASFTDSSRTFPSEVNVFTDGSKQAGRTGAGYCIFSKGKLLQTGSYRLPDSATVFQAEVFAIDRAVRNLYFLPRARYVKIHVDSQAALLALKASHVTSRVVYDAIQTLRDVALSLDRLALVWTKAHVGTPGNEEADRQAKAGCLISDIETLSLPLSAVRHSLSEAFLRRWQHQWTQSSDARASKKLLSGPDKRRAKHLLRLPKKHTNLLIRLITNHTSLLSHSKTIDPSVNDSCRLCLQQSETFFHLVSDCPALRALRTDVFLDEPPHASSGWTVAKMLIFAKSQPITDLLRGYSDQDIELGIV